jgi:hypothetical protein
MLQFSHIHISILLTDLFSPSRVYFLFYNTCWVTHAFLNSRINTISNWISTVRVLKLPSLKISLLSCLLFP